MLWIEPADFIISSPPDEVRRFRDKEDPQTRVTLPRGYCISRFELTQWDFGFRIALAETAGH